MNSIEKNNTELVLKVFCLEGVTSVPYGTVAFRRLKQEAAGVLNMVCSPLSVADDYQLFFGLIFFSLRLRTAREPLGNRSGTAREPLGNRSRTAREPLENRSGTAWITELCSLTFSSYRTARHRALVHGYRRAFSNGRTTPSGSASKVCRDESTFSRSCQ